MQVIKGRLPSPQTTVIVTPALKKHGLDLADTKNYQPISNLYSCTRSWKKPSCGSSQNTFLRMGLRPKLQHGFRKHHPTDSVLFRYFLIYTIFNGQGTHLTAPTAHITTSSGSSIMLIYVTNKTTRKCEKCQWTHVYSGASFSGC